MPRQALLLGGLGCPVPGCGGMREPQSNGDGYVRDVCDRCTARVQEVRVLRHRIARLTGQGQGPAPVIAPTGVSEPAMIDPAPGAHRPRRGGISAAILKALSTLGSPARIDQIFPLVVAECRTTTRGSVMQLLYTLAKTGAIVASPRDRSRVGSPRYYALPPRADQEVAP